MSLRLLRTALAATLTAAAVGTAIPATADELPLPQVEITNLTPLIDGSLTGPFTADVSIDLAGSASVSLYGAFSVYSNWVGTPSQTVTAEQCPDTCTVSLAFDTTQWETATMSGWSDVNVWWRSAEGMDGLAYRRLNYQAPVDSSWVNGFERDETANTAAYHPSVLDSGGSVVIGSQGLRGADEVLEARVYPGNDYEPLPEPVLTATGAWESTGADGSAPVGRVRLNTAGLAEGTYRLIVRPRNGSGQYGASGESTLTVRHDPAVKLWSLPQHLTVGSKLVVGVALTRPLRDGVTWSTLRVSVDGGPAQTLPVDYWNVLLDPVQPVTGSATVPVSLSPGTHTVTTEVLDTKGNPIGAPITGTVRVVAFTETATVSTLVVGQPGSVLFKGTAPTGLTYESCYFGLYERSGMIGGGGVCKPGTTSYSQSVAWTPQTAGAGKVEYSVHTRQGLDSPMRTIPVTVYARRSATVSAPSSSKYGTRMTATVTVRDVKSLAGSPVAAPGAAVTLQRKAAGTSTWVTVGTGKSDSYGRAAVPFTNAANGRLRAVVASSVPGKTVLTAERSITSISTVSWSSLPTSARSGALTYAAVYAKPYEKGATVRVQARLLGKSTWNTLGSAAVSSTGYAKPGLRLYTRGTWEVRVVRVGTTLRSTGYSTVKRISVR